MSKTSVKVKLVGEDGNAHVIISRVNKALQRAGHKELAKCFLHEAQSGDYDHLLWAATEYVEVT